MDAIGTDAVCHIFRDLDVDDWCAMRTVCKRWQQIMDHIPVVARAFKFYGLTNKEKKASNWWDFVWQRRIIRARAGEARGVQLCRKIPGLTRAVSLWDAGLPDHVAYIAHSKLVVLNLHQRADVGVLNIEEKVDGLIPYMNRAKPRLAIFTDLQGKQRTKIVLADPLKCVELSQRLFRNRYTGINKSGPIGAWGTSPEKLAEFSFDGDVINYNKSPRRGLFDTIGDNWLCDFRGGSNLLIQRNGSRSLKVAEEVFSVGPWFVDCHMASDSRVYDVDGNYWPIEQGGYVEAALLYPLGDRQIHLIIGQKKKKHQVVWGPAGLYRSTELRDRPGRRHYMMTSVGLVLLWCNHSQQIHPVTD